MQNTTMYVPDAVYEEFLDLRHGPPIFAFSHFALTREMDRSHIIAAKLAGNNTWYPDISLIQTYTRHIVSN